MDGPVGERSSQGCVDEAVLVDQRQPAEAPAHNRDVEVIAAAGAVYDCDLGRLRKGFLEQRPNRLACHR